MSALDRSRTRATHLGIDVGSAFIKAVLLDAELEPIASARAPTPWQAKPTGVVAHAGVLRSRVFATIDHAIARAGRVSVETVGVVSMGESGVAVDDVGRPVWPAIPWHSPVGAELAADLAAAIPSFPSQTGRMPSALCSIVKWRHLGPSDGVAHRWFSVAEYVVAALGAAPSSEGSLLSRTGALAIGNATLFDAALEWAAVPAGFVTDPVPAGTPAGSVTAGPRVARGAMATVAGLDCYAAAVAAGVTGSDDVFLSCGTSGAAIRVLEPDAHIDLAAAGALGLTVDRWLDGKRLVLLGASPCGLVLQPLRDTIGPPSARTDERRWADAFRAVARGQRQVLDALIAVAGPVRRYVGAGGWLRENGLVEAIELEVRPIEVAADAELGAIGAARVAAIGHAVE